MKTKYFGIGAILGAGVLAGCLLLDESCDVVVASTPVTQQENKAWSSSDPVMGTFVQLVDANRGYSLNSVLEKERYTLGGVGSPVSVMRKTTDGGRTWALLQGGLSKVYFTDLNTGWAVGSGGGIYKTVNGGANWTAQNSGILKRLSSVHFPTASTGYAVGEQGTILKTADGGLTWVKQASGTKNDLYSVYFTSANTGYAVGDKQVLLKTTNGGGAWTLQDSAPDGYLASVSFIDADNGWAAGFAYVNSTKQWDLRVLKTVNGGKTWQVATSHLTPSSGLGADSPVNQVFSIQFTSAATGWVLISPFSGEAENILLKTTDAGTTWTVNTRIPFGQATFSFADADNGYLMGGDSLLVTHNGGLTWSGRTTGFKHTPTSLHFGNPATGWATDEGGGIFKTVDGGETWVVKRGGLAGEATSFYFLDSSRGWAVGYSGFIAKTTDGGELWIPQSSGSSRDFGAVHFTDPLNGHVVGRDGTILTTVDAGSHWTAQPSGTSNALNGVYFTSTATGYAVGSGGALLQTRNGGALWTGVSAGTAQDLRAVHFADAAHGWAVGGEEVSGGVQAGGVILRTTDAGATWSARDSVTPVGLDAVSFVDALTGYAVGGGIPSTATPDPISNPSCGYKYVPELLYYQQILKTTDGGLTWTAEKTNSLGRAYDYDSDVIQTPLLSVSCLASGVCLATGETGMWRRP